MSNERPSSRSHLGLLIILIIIAIAAWLFVFNRQSVIDYVRAWQYDPSASAVIVRNDLQLTHVGELYFDASQTDIEDAGPFNQSCDQHQETNNPILGCYVDQSIYIFNVTNSKLGGIEEVTAAHELLHAAYDRMSASEKKTVNAELEAAYEKVKTPDLEQRMAYYQKSEPGERLNELHSILGSEFPSLGPTLEAHYAKYFRDRARIVEYYKSYSAVFTDTSDKLKALSRQINAETQDVNNRIKTYNRDIAKLGSDVQAFNAKSDAGGFSSQADFNQQRDGLTARQAALTSERKAILATIDSIDSLRKQYNQLASEYNQLSQSINSSLTPTLQLQPAN